MPQPAAISGWIQTQSGLLLPSASGLPMSSQAWQDTISRLDVKSGGSEYGIHFCDDFAGYAIDNKRWSNTLVGGSVGVLAGGAGGQAQLQTSTTANNSALLDWGGATSVLASKNPSFGCYFNLNPATNVLLRIGLYDGTENNKIEMYLDTSSSANLQSATVKAAASSGTSGAGGFTFAANTWYSLRILVTSTKVLFYVGSLPAYETAGPTLFDTETTNIPTVAMEPRLYVKTTDTTNKVLLVDYVDLIHDR